MRFQRQRSWSLRSPILTRAHGSNESLHLGDFAAACLAETLLLDAVAHIT